MLLTSRRSACGQSVRAEILVTALPRVRTPAPLLVSLGSSVYQALRANPDRRQRCNLSNAAAVEPQTTPDPSGTIHRDTIIHSRFHWPIVHGSGEVSVWGTFNKWARGVKLHRASAEHEACVIMPLKPGNYEFKYVLDGVWLTAPHEPTAINSEGTLNNCRVVAPTITFRLLAPGASQVLVVGDWDGFQYGILLERQAEPDLFAAAVQMPPGCYSYSFVVDQQVTLDTELESFPLSTWHGGRVHRIWSLEPAIFRIFYCTGWDEAVLHYRRKQSADAPPEPEWQATTCLNLPSRGNALGLWKMATVIPTVSDEAIEFYFSNGGGGAQGSMMTYNEFAPTVRREDRPGGGLQAYVAPFPGAFKLVQGLVRPFPRGSEARIMLVSDIDGTMIGDVGSPDVYHSSARFIDYWENAAALAGSVLVYNTGRSLGSVVELMKRCGGKVAVPDVIISAVGTKVWHLNEPAGRCNAVGTKWVEDMQWTKQLDSGWDLGKVRASAYQLLGHYHDEGALKMLDDGSEHQHRIALCGSNDKLPHITTTLKNAFQKDGLQVRIIVSGSGSHRYVDCVSVHAGKERALQYVRQQYGVPEHLCVAAGDSGNDVLMLEGNHPGIIVGNAQAELVSWLVKQPQDNKIILADATYADGILEGLARHSLY